MEKGYIYVLINPSMKGMVKIGKTNRNPEDRAKELSAGTNIPFQFQVGYDILVSDIDLAEKKVHKKLEKFRVANNREFFEISLREAVDVINKVVKDEKIGLNSGENWDYLFEENKYSDLKELVLAFNQNKSSWDNGLNHIKKGGIEKWLKDVNNYDHLILFESLKEQYSSRIDLFIITLLFKLNSEIPFRIYNYNLDAENLKEIIIRSANKLNDIEKDIKTKLEDGTLLEYYEIFKDHRKETDPLIDEIFNLYINKCSNYFISRYVYWHKNPNEFYFNISDGAIEPEEIKYLITKDEIKALNKKNYIPYEIQCKIISNDKKQLKEAWHVLFGDIPESWIGNPMMLDSTNPIEWNERHGSKLINKDSSEYIASKKLLKSAGSFSWPLELYETVSYNLIHKSKKEEFDKQVIPQKLLNGLKSEDLKTYIFCARILTRSFYSEEDHKEFIKQKSDSNNHIKEIIEEFNTYHNLYRVHNKFQAKLSAKKEMFVQSGFYDSHFIDNSWEILNDHDRKLFYSDPFFKIKRSYYYSFPLKEDLQYIYSIMSEYVLPKKINIKLYEDGYLNKVYWFMEEFNRYSETLNSDTLILKNKIESLILHPSDREKLNKGVLENSDYESLSKKVFLNKKSIENILIPLYQTRGLYDPDVEMFSKSVISPKIKTV